jgi:hypothetical protein
LFCCLDEAGNFPASLVAILHITLVRHFETTQSIADSLANLKKTNSGKLLVTPMKPNARPRHEGFYASLRKWQ